MPRAKRRSRPCYAVAIVVTIVAGLLSRSSVAEHLPAFARMYAGDTLWALAVFLTLGLAFPKAQPRRLAIAAALISYGVELSQLYQAPWINAIRHTVPGALLLGFGFQWSDLACYSLGVLLGTAGEFALREIIPANTHPSAQSTPHLEMDETMAIGPRVREGGKIPIEVSADPWLWVKRSPEPECGQEKLTPEQDFFPAPTPPRPGMTSTHPFRRASC